MLRNRVFRLRIVLIWVCRPVRGSISCFSRIAFLGFEKFRYKQCQPGSGSINWCSGIAFHGAKLSNMGCAVQKCGWFLMPRNRVFRLRKAEGVHLLMLRNGFFRLWFVQVWVMPSCKGVDYLLLRNRVFMIRNDQLWAVPSCKRLICWCSWIAF